MPALKPRVWHQDEEETGVDVDPMCRLFLHVFRKASEERPDIERVNVHSTVKLCLTAPRMLALPCLREPLENCRGKCRLRLAKVSMACPTDKTFQIDRESRGWIDGSKNVQESSVGSEKQVLKALRVSCQIVSEGCCGELGYQPCRLPPPLRLLDLDAGAVTGGSHS